MCETPCQVLSIISLFKPHSCVPVPQDSTTVPILKRRKLRVRDRMCLACGPTARKELHGDSTPGSMSIVCLPTLALRSVSSGDDTRPEMQGPGEDWRDRLAKRSVVPDSQEAP